MTLAEKHARVVLIGRKELEKAEKECETSKRHGLRLVEQLAALQAENEWLTSERIQQMEHAMNSAMLRAEQEEQSDKEDLDAEQQVSNVVQTPKCNNYDDQCDGLKAEVAGLKSALDEAVDLGNALKGELEHSRREMGREQTLAEDMSRDTRRAERERDEALAAVTETRRLLQDVTAELAREKALRCEARRGDDISAVQHLFLFFYAFFTFFLPFLKQGNGDEKRKGDISLCSKDAACAARQLDANAPLEDRS